MSVIVAGKTEEIRGLVTRSWYDNPGLRLTGEDLRARSTRWIRSVILHTTKGLPTTAEGKPQEIRPGIGPSTDLAARIARLWSTDGRNAGAHLAVDHDGTVSCHADLMTEAAYHAGAANNVSIGVEIYQGAAGELYAGQLDAVVLLVDWLTRRFGIQRQIPDRYRGPLKRLEEGAVSFVGVFGHRDCSDNRGPGDPGDAVFDRLAEAGYERFDLSTNADRKVWQPRQTDAAVEIVADGIPGPATITALARRGRPHGMWVPRPSDAD